MMNAQISKRSSQLGNDGFCVLLSWCLELEKAEIYQEIKNSGENQEIFREMSENLCYRREISSAI